jgi:hypothetical protein
MERFKHCGAEVAFPIPEKGQSLVYFMPVNSISKEQFNKEKAHHEINILKHTSSIQKSKSDIAFYISDLELKKKEWEVHPERKYYCGSDQEGRIKSSIKQAQDNIAQMSWYIAEEKLELFKLNQRKVIDIVNFYETTLVPLVDELLYLTSTLQDGST